MMAIRVHADDATSCIPESAAVGQCAAVVQPQVVVVVVRAELHAIHVFERIIRGGTVLCQPAHKQLVVVPLWQYSDKTVLRVVPFACFALLKLEHKLILATHCQFRKYLVADPVEYVAWVTDTVFVIIPRTIGVESLAVVSLDQLIAPGYKTYIGLHYIGRPKLAHCEHGRKGGGHLTPWIST